MKIISRDSLILYNYLQNILETIFKGLYQIRINMLVCDNCGKECVNKCGLTIHKRACKHTTEFKCKYCDKIYYSSYNLKKHIDDVICDNHKQEINRNIINMKSEIEAKNKQIQELEQKYKIEIEAKNNKIKELEIINNELKNSLDKTDKINEHILVTNKTLANKVGVTNNNHSTNHHVTYNLPVLTHDIIGDCIKPIQFTNNNNEIDTYCAQINSNGLNQYVYKTDKNRNHLVYNLDGTEVRDEQGIQICEKIAAHPQTKIKKNELLRIQKEIECNIQDGDLDPYELEVKCKQLGDIKIFAEQIDKSKSLKKSITKTLIHANQSNDFILTQFTKELELQVKNKPFDFLFSSPVSYIARNSRMTDHTNLIVKDDRDKPHKLTEKDIRYILNELYRNSISFDSSMNDEEVLAFMKMCKERESIREIYMSAFQYNINRYSRMTENTSEINSFLSEMLESISMFEN
jgi:hypothetical protein